MKSVNFLFQQGKDSNMAVWGSDPMEKVDSNTVLLNTIESFILGKLHVVCQMIPDHKFCFLF